METGKKAFTHHVLVFCVAIVSERLDGNTAAGIEQANDLQIFGIHQLDQVLHNDIHTVLMEVAVLRKLKR